LSRAYGGFQQQVELESTWKKYAFDLEDQYGDSNILFALVYRGECEEGTFFLDDVEVSVVERKTVH
jgi:hypothetical protein